MTDTLMTILKSIDDKEYGIAQKSIESCVSEYCRDKRFADIAKILNEVLDHLGKKSNTIIREVMIDLMIECQHYH